MKENHMSQIVIGIIVTVVGGVILAWIIGEGRFSQSASPEVGESSTFATIAPTSVQATTSSTNSSSSVEVQPTPWGIMNPASPIPEEERALISDYAVWVSGLTLQRDNMWFDVYIENVDSQSHILRFTKISFTLKDDIGNEYAPYFADDSRMYELSQLSIEAGEVVKLKGTNMFWNDPTSLPHFLGPIDSQASKLIVAISGDSPFNGLEFEIDL